VNATGTITVAATNTAGTASSNQTLCINTALTNITRTTTGATGISNNGVSGANGLPAGVSASWAANTITISGTPTVSGIFNYSIPLTEVVVHVNATGTITVTAAKYCKRCLIHSNSVYQYGVDEHHHTTTEQPAYRIIT
jgi:hypothetical protein